MWLYLCDYKICHHMNGGWMDKDFAYGHQDEGSNLTFDRPYNCD